MIGIECTECKRLGLLDDRYPTKGAKAVDWTPERGLDNRLRKFVCYLGHCTYKICTPNEIEKIRKEFNYDRNGNTTSEDVSSQE